MATISNPQISTASAALDTAFEDFGTQLSDELESKATSASLGTGAKANITVSTADPSGGVNGDVWLKTAS